jgi:hypothetical protein
LGDLTLVTDVPELLGLPLAECADAAADVSVISCVGELEAAGTQ